MHKTGQELFKLMFRPGESVCVSPNKYGYHSVALSSIFENEVTLLNTKFRDGADQAECIEKYPTDDLTLVALNPIQGWRDDVSCTAFRNFLIEMDYGPLPEQLAYADKIGLPYSAVVFSGNKSLHFLVSLDIDLPNENVWRTMAEWTLAIASAADQNTKNPSRSIRIPGAFREPGKKQLMVRFNGPTSLQKFSQWLALHPEAKPKEPERRMVSSVLDPTLLKEWVAEALDQPQFIGAKRGRNKEWFAIACEFALAGYSEDDTMDYLSGKFIPDRDFKEREWKTSIRSAFKYIYARK
jgi:hypothetical protein